MRTTIGNIGGEADGASSPVVLFSAYGLYLSISKKTAAFIVSVIDTAACLVFWICIMQWKRFQTKVSEGINEYTITCAGSSNLLELCPSGR